MPKKVFRVGDRFGIGSIRMFQAQTLTFLWDFKTPWVSAMTSLRPFGTIGDTPAAASATAVVVATQGVRREPSQNATIKEEFSPFWHGITVCGVYDSASVLRVCFARCRGDGPHGDESVRDR